MEDIIVIQGTDLRLKMTIEGITDLGGAEESLTNVDLKVIVYTQARYKKELEEKRIQIDNQTNDCYLLVDTSDLSPGTLCIEIELNLPDGNFEPVGGRRKEKYRYISDIKIIK